MTEHQASKTDASRRVAPDREKVRMARVRAASEHRWLLPGSTQLVVARVARSFPFTVVKLSHLHRMSYAGRRRGNKVKKGVQFTVMVVG